MNHPVREVLEHALARDPRVHLVGEAVDLSPATTGLRAGWPDRVHLLPAADATLVGFAVGLALTGARPVVELAGPPSLWGALPQIVQEAVPARLPVLIRVPLAPVEPLLEALLDALAVTRVLAPSNAAEAASMVEAALAADGPTVIIEALAALATPGGAAPALDLDRARIVRPGQHVTVTSWGHGVATALEIAQELDQEGVSVEVVDLRTLAPLDLATLSDSVTRTGRAVALDGPGAVLAAVTRAAFLRLESPPAQAGADGLAEVIRSSSSY